MNFQSCIELLRPTDVLYSQFLDVMKCALFRMQMGGELQADAASAVLLLASAKAGRIQNVR